MGVTALPSVSSYPTAHRAIGSSVAIGMDRRAAIYANPVVQILLALFCLLSSSLTRDMLRRSAAHLSEQTGCN
jgi:hypothetical protein